MTAKVESSRSRHKSGDYPLIATFSHKQLCFIAAYKLQILAQRFNQSTSIVSQAIGTVSGCKWQAFYTSGILSNIHKVCFSIRVQSTAT